MTPDKKDSAQGAGPRGWDLPASSAFLREYLRIAPLSRALIRSKEIELILSEVQPGYERPGRIIDLGHGDGLFARILEKHGMKIFVGVDRSHEELLRARGRSGAHLVVGDMEHAPFRSGTFDDVVSNCVLEHIENLDAAFSETARMAKNGGRVLATVVADNYERHLFWPQCFRFFGMAQARASYLNYIARKFVHRRYFTVDEWIAAAERASLSCTTVKPYSGRRRQMLMDLFLPFVVFARLLRAVIGREVIRPIPWPSAILTRYLDADPTETKRGGSANVFLVFQVIKPAIPAIPLIESSIVNRKSNI